MSVPIEAAKVNTPGQPFTGGLLLFLSTLYPIGALLSSPQSSMALSVMAFFFHLPLR